MPGRHLASVAPLGSSLNAMSEQEILESLDFAKSQNLPVFVLGRRIESSRCRPRLRRVGFDGSASRAGPGTIPSLAPLPAKTGTRLSLHCVERGFGGVECLSGIPGLVGGTPVQNVGAYGQEISRRAGWCSRAGPADGIRRRVVERRLRIHVPLKHFQHDAKGSLHCALRSPMPFGREPRPM